MKKYIIAFCLFCLSLFLIDEVYAATTDGWGLQVQKSNIAQAFDCTSTNSCTSSLTTTSNNDSYIDSIVVGSHYTTSSTTTDSNGLMWVFSVNPGLKANYLYSISAYFCNYNSQGYKFIDFVTGSTQGDVNSKKYHPTMSLTGAINKISGDVYYNSEQTSGFTCSYINRIFAPSVDSQYIGYQITTSSSVTGVQVYSGYQITELGRNDLVTASEVQSILNNSNLASADSVEEVEKSVEEVQEEITSLQEQQEQQHNEMKDTITNSDSSDATSSAGGFFNDFSNDDFGLSDIITMPLTFIKGLANNTCNSLILPLPFVEKNVTLPCMTTIYETHFPSLLTLYQSITTGYIAYWVCINIFKLVQGFKNPDNDEIEVMDL